MPGDVIRVVPKTFVSFSSIPNSSTAPTTIWLARRIDVSEWRELVVMVRLHPGSTISGTWTQSPYVSVHQDGYTAEDPAVFTNGSVFSGSTAPGFTTLLISGPTLPALSNSFEMQAINVPPNAGGLLAIAISGQTGTTAVADLYLSVDLSRKS